MARAGYRSDLSDTEWVLIEPYLPAAKSSGRPRPTDFRQLVDALFYLLRTGCQWRFSPNDFPPWGTVWWYFRRWRLDGVWTRLHRALFAKARQEAGRDPCPSVVIMDSQSVKTTKRGAFVALTATKR